MSTISINVYGNNNTIIEGNANNTAYNSPSSANSVMSGNSVLHPKNPDGEDGNFKDNLSIKTYSAINKYIDSIILKSKSPFDQSSAYNINRSTILSSLNDAISDTSINGSNIDAEDGIGRLREWAAAHGLSNTNLLVTALNNDSNIDAISRLREQMAVRELSNERREIQPGISPSQPIQPPDYAPYNSNTPRTIRIDGKDGNNEDLPSYITRNGESSVEVYQPSWHLDDSGNKIYRPQNAFQPPEITGFKISSGVMTEDHMVYKYEKIPSEGNA
ncbi:hypothetical protein [Dyella nitratireducens]|uniref:Uncharacterized protein n=1 Tax=Dyella nitratireducens TaxID=1849580 RepID=A0ABQ1FPS5_9GAMM|nr:hypothetical protein [Dyella nitratireducens]GGA23380.1 hypothetical protein GCM10010981_09610 [Dyella nitratireducens]GLQ43976.1 hypothetical protein GCM10007902_38260 [Dyella nitratireducens]